MSDLLNKHSVTPENFRRMREIFESALERPAEERQAFLESACGGDTVLIHEVQRMLAAELQNNPLLDGSEQFASPEVARGVCPSCKADIAVSDRFCRSCGTPLESDSRIEGRFRTGALFANRFRIIGLLGRGGMGEVYRANDLQLDEPVALKFLTAVRFDELARTRLRREVRLARQIAHANVCRVYDIGEAQGELYLSMEYVDGEDLAALLRRIGRLPPDKCVEIALKLSAGLAAAHRKGVLHRDLKPSNIMIDGSGEVRIMDFGLAAIAGELHATQSQEGTPFYMAPEQLAGEKLSVQSDIYALGLVLYEMLTGKPPFLGNTPAELRRLREESRVTRPSMLVPDLDPMVERTILRCLDPDPKMRPASVLAVSALLPGGDPLAKALAAGETPSPEMIAAAGSTEPVRPAIAITALIGTAVGLAALCLTAPKVQMLSRLSLEKSPEVLRVTAQEIVRDLGYTERPADWAQGLRSDEGYFAEMQTKVFGDEQWRRILSMPPQPISFWYRQSPTSIRAIEDPRRIPRFDRVGPDDPLTTAGMVSVGLDMQGRLLRFTAQPELDRSLLGLDDQSRVPDWAPLFTAARLDLNRFTPTQLQFAPSVATDTRASWIGTYAERSDIPLRVNAGSFGGRIVFFEIMPPWSGGRIPREGYAHAVEDLLFFATILCGVLLARVNWKTGRADLSGAWRSGLFFSVLYLLTWALASHHPTARLALVALWSTAIPFALTWGVSVSLCYLAIEPWIRREWPGTMITWSRVLAGRWRDPLVGRDMLVGLLWILGVGLLIRLAEFNVIRLGGPPAHPPAQLLGTPESSYLSNLMGGLSSIAGILQSLFLGFGFTFILFGLLLLLTKLFRNKWIAAGVCVVLLFASRVVWDSHWSTLSFSFLAQLISIVGMLRFGLFATVIMMCFANVTSEGILTNELTMWYGTSSLVAVILVSAVALLGFRLSQLGKRLSRT